MKATDLTLAVAALAVGTLVLTGCDPANTTGSSGASDGAGSTCDPHGWGPLAGCHSASGTDSGTDSTGDEAAGTGTVPCAADKSDPDLDAGNGCGTGSSPWFKKKIRDEDQKTTEAVADNDTDDGTVTVAWIVVRIDITGLRECLIDLRQALPDRDAHFSHRVTTPEDCKAQQVDTVYRPVDK